MRRAFVSGLDHSIGHHPRFQEAANQPQEANVLHPIGESSHQHIMIDSIEEFLQINVHHPVLSFGYILFRLGHRIQRASLRAKAVATLRECRLENRLQYLMERLLDESIHHRGHAERSNPAIGLGDVHSAHCPRQVPVFQ
ncbi:hypothetical protein D3C84_987390 [compost metagenome]